MTDTNTAAALSAEADGWIKHDGGPSPVPGQMVECKGRTGRIWTACLSDHLRWTHKRSNSDIIAYRVATPAPLPMGGHNSKPVEGDYDDCLAASSSGEGVWDRPVNLGYQSDEPTLREMVSHYYRSHSMPDPLTWTERYLAALHPSSAADAEPVACSDEALEIANANHEKFERLWYLAKDDVDRLKLAICGGEDVPGAIDAVSVEDCEGFIAEERSRHIDTEARLEYVRRSRDGAADRADRLYRALVEVRDSVETYPLDDSQTCMCGSPVEGHNVGSGHAPVSQADHAISLIVEAINKALGVAAIPDHALIGAGRPDDYEGPDVGMHDTEIVESEND